MNSDMRILVACDGRELGSKIEAELRRIGELDVSRVKHEEVTARLRDLPSVILLTVGQNPTQELQLIRELVLLVPSVRFGVVGPATDAKFILQVL